MRPDKDNIEEILEQALPSATRPQMEAARDRVVARLRAERLRGGAAPARQGDARATVWWRPAIAAVVAAVVIAVIVSVGAPLRDRGVYAVLEAADTSIYRIDEGNRVPIRVGDRIAAQQTLRSNGGSGAVLALADGSRIEIGSKSEMWWDRADGGLLVRLTAGSIIVSAAKDATGRLYVQTKDMTASVERTTSLVNAVDDGSSVAVIEGEAEVREGAIERTLHPGQHLSTSPTLDARPLPEAIAWSRNADRHLAILAAFEKAIATTAGALTPLKETASRQSDSGQRAGAAEPAFDEASVRLCDPTALPATPAGARAGGAGSFQMTPGRTNVLCMTVATLIRVAYGYGPGDMPAPRLDFDNVYGLGGENGRRVRGGPDWIRSDRYTIEAVTDQNPNARTMSGPMLRRLLEQRFQLSVHVETELAPGFALTIAPGGLKTKRVDADACTPVSPQAAGGFSPPPDHHEIERVHRGEQPFCGLRVWTNGPNMLLVGGASAFPPRADILVEILGARVIDRTDIPTTALFNYALEFAPDDRTLGPLAGRGRGLTQTSDVPRAADIFTAFKEQLGLQLDAVQAPREYIVVDRIERPSPN